MASVPVGTPGPGGPNSRPGVALFFPAPPGAPALAGCDFGLAGGFSTARESSCLVFFVTFLASGAGRPLVFGSTLLLGGLISFGGGSGAGTGSAGAGSAAAAAGAGSGARAPPPPGGSGTKKPSATFSGG